MHITKITAIISREIAKNEVEAEAHRGKPLAALYQTQADALKDIMKKLVDEDKREQSIPQTPVYRPQGKKPRRFHIYDHVIVVEDRYMGASGMITAFRKIDGAIHAIVSNSLVNLEINTSYLIHDDMAEALGKFKRGQHVQTTTEGKTVRGIVLYQRRNELFVTVEGMHGNGRYWVWVASKTELIQPA